MSRPYFETEVVKVKKERECIGEINIRGNRQPLYVENDRIYFEGKEKQKSNWVNGENLDKIEFPCFCTHKDKSNGYSGYGMLASNLDGSGNKEYVLVDIGKQREEVTSVSSSSSLKDLIEMWDVHIIKGKIILFEEENKEYDIDIEGDYNE